MSGTVNTFGLAELKFSRQRNVHSVFMLALHNIDPSCVISSAFEGSPEYIYIALTATYP